MLKSAWGSIVQQIGRMAISRVQVTKKKHSALVIHDQRNKFARSKQYHVWHLHTAETKRTHSTVTM